MKRFINMRTISLKHSQPQFCISMVGELSYKNDKHAWIAIEFYQHRIDNLLCAAVVIDQTVIVKTVMYHFSFENKL